MSAASEAVAPPAVSVIIRNFNRGARLARAIDSVLAQNYQDFEILLIDDASTDDSVQFVQEHYGHLPNLRIVELLVNRGAGGAANAGLDCARGRFVAFLDSDDAWLPEFLQVHVAALEGNPRAVITYGSFIQVWEDYAIERVIRAHASANQRLDMLLGGFVYTQSMTVSRRLALLEFGGFDERLRISHDFDLWLRLALELPRPFVCVDRPLVRYYMSGDGVTADHDAWLREYHVALDRGYAHRAAKPWRHRQDETKRKMRAALIARREVDRWLARTRERSVSAIVRTRNRLPLLREAIASVREQAWDELEIVVINEGSSDGTAEWLASEASDDMKVVNFDPPRGRAGALNYGALVAEGDLLAFLDDDDRWLPGYIAAQVRANSFVVGEPAFSFSDYYLSGERSLEPARRTHMHGLQSSDLLHYSLFNVFPHSLSMLALPRAHFQAVGGADERLDVGEDVSLYLRLLGHYCGARKADAVQQPPVHIRQPLVLWRRETSGCDRPAMMARYLRDAPAIYEEFFNSDAGRDYRFLREDVVNHLRLAMQRVYRQHFGIGAQP